MDPRDFTVLDASFDHASWLHGVGHTCRVMAYTWVMGAELVSGRERELAFCAAFIHDLARLHDGVCRDHGPRAAELKLPKFADFFAAQGIHEEDLEPIRTAVHWHSLPQEVPADHAHYPVVALLKDADALDRIRLGPYDLNPDMLRFSRSRELIRVSRHFFMRTLRWKGGEVQRYIDCLQQLCEKRR